MESRQRGRLKSVSFWLKMRVTWREWMLLLVALGVSSCTQEVDSHKAKLAFDDLQKIEALKGFMPEDHASLERVSRSFEGRCLVLAHQSFRRDPFRIEVNAYLFDDPADIKRAIRKFRMSRQAAHVDFAVAELNDKGIATGLVGGSDGIESDVVEGPIWVNAVLSYGGRWDAPPYLRPVIDPARPWGSATRPKYSDYGIAKDTWAMKVFSDLSVALQARTSKAGH
jgi:hypothetical protein